MLQGRLHTQKDLGSRNMTEEKRLEVGWVRIDKVGLGGEELDIIKVY